MGEPIRTLIVDDEERIRFVLKETLQRVGHQVTMVSSGEEALDRLHDTAFDVLLLDLMLSGAIDGQRVLEAVRWRWPATVVIMVTGHGSLDSAVEAIREGVDGYLLKPVNPEQVRQAVQEALYHRKKLLEAEKKAEESVLLQKGPLAVDQQRHSATYGGQPLDIPRREFELLIHLMRNAPEVISAKDLVVVVRGYNPEFEHEARDIVKWYIYRLRQIVEPDPSNPRHILNVRGVGYRFAE